MENPKFRLEVSINETTGEPVAAYIRVRGGRVVGASGVLLGIELLAPCPVDVLDLDRVSEKEPESVRQFLRCGIAIGGILFHRLEDRGKTDGCRARAVRAHAELHLVGVAMDDRDLADRNAKAIRDELAERRLVTLAVTMRAREDLDGADRVDAHLRGFPQADAGT